MNISIEGITARAENEYKDYIHNKMMEAFELASTTLTTLLANGVVMPKEGNTDDIKMMIAKEYFKAMTTPAFYWISKRKAELLREAREKEGDSE